MTKKDSEERFPQHNQIVQEFSWGQVIWRYLGDRSKSSLALAEIKILPQKTVASHVHSCDEEIITILSGEGKMEVGSRKIHVLPSKIIHIPVGAEHKIENPYNEQLVFQVVYNLILDKDFAQNSDDNTINLFIGILEDRLGIGYPIKEGKSIVELAKRFIQINLQKNLRLETIANAVAISPSHFSRLFKEGTGKTFTQYLTDARIEMAESLIKQGKTVNEAAKSAGFNSPSYFRAVYKKIKGVPPTEYLKK